MQRTTWRRRGLIAATVLVVLATAIAAVRYRRALPRVAWIVPPTVTRTPDPSGPMWTIDDDAQLSGEPDGAVIHVDAWGIPEADGAISRYFVETRVSLIHDVVHRLTTGHGVGPGEDLGVYDATGETRDVAGVVWRRLELKSN